MRGGGVRKGGRGLLKTKKSSYFKEVLEKVKEYVERFNQNKTDLCVTRTAAPPVLNCWRQLLYCMCRS